MNKKIIRAGVLAIALPMLIALLGGCSDQFLRDKTNYNLISPDAAYKDYEGARSRVDYLYRVLQPGPNSGEAYLFNWISHGRSDIWSQATEEYGSIDKDNYWINETGLDITQLNNSTQVTGGDYFYFEMKETAPYGRIRECNDVIEHVQASSLTADEKDELLGQAYFWRAWIYYNMVKYVGGIPIIDYVQDPIVGDGTKESVVVPRSTTKACIEFICKDLQAAADLLPTSWLNQAADYGRVTEGTALALMGRVRLLYASPLFNRQDDPARWETAYEVNKTAKELLHYSMTPGTNASEWARMFAPKEMIHPEAVMFTLYSIHADNGKRNSWESAIRPKNIYSSNSGIDVTAQMVDLFPMADGKRPAALAYSKLPASGITYDPSLFFLDRDPRFYRTFAFPGVRWAALASLDSEIRDDSVGIFLYPYQGTEYELWSYAWFKDAADRDDPDAYSGSWVADGIGDTRRTVYLRKRSDDYDIAKSSMYDFSTANRFGYSYAPYLELRYGEVLLNFAEAACGAGKGQEALDALRELRMRVGYTGDCGLDGGLAGDRAALFSAILYERQIELAYEGKRFDDMRRWMLWDGGATQAQIQGAPGTWVPSGWGGNTCEYLGVPPVNGTRRQRIYVYDKMRTGVQDHNKYDNAGTLVLNDPILAAAAAGDATAQRPKALDLMTDPVNGTGAMADLIGFYQDNLGVKRPDNLDGTIDDGPLLYLDFKPQNYFIGLKWNAQSSNPTLLQTIGWDDRQGHGSWFDPLAE